MQVPQTQIQTVKYRFDRIVKQVATDFLSNIDSPILGIYVGSYGRNTAIDLSDVDILISLPWSVYFKYDNYWSNGQSSLLQAIKNSIEKTYPMTKMAGDGQVVVIEFTDGIRFEVLPGFRNEDYSFWYPDTHDGGRWKRTNPLPEQQAMKELDGISNYAGRRLARMVRSWKNYNNVKMGGLLIDTYVYKFLSSWKCKSRSYEYYGWMTKDFFDFLRNQDDSLSYIHALGSNQHVDMGHFTSKASKAYENAMQAVYYEQKGYSNLANNYWSSIYGTRF